MTSFLVWMRWMRSRPTGCAEHDAAPQLLTDLPMGMRTVSRPFLKWAGGKRQLIPQLLETTMPLRWIRRYHEPFLGGGALFVVEPFARTPCRPYRPRSTRLSPPMR